MVAIAQANMRVLDQLSPVIDVNPKCSHHSISIEGLTGSVTLKIVPHGLTQSREFDGNVLVENGHGVFVLGAIDKLEVVPENAVDYKISMSSF